jgi:hypothetical protein
MSFAHIVRQRTFGDHANDSGSTPPQLRVASPWFKSPERGNVRVTQRSQRKSGRSVAFPPRRTKSRAFTRTHFNLFFSVFLNVRKFDDRSHRMKTEAEKRRGRFAARGNGRHETASPGLTGGPARPSSYSSVSHVVRRRREQGAIPFAHDHVRSTRALSRTIFSR